MRVGFGSDFQQQKKKKKKTKQKKLKAIFFLVGHNFSISEDSSNIGYSESALMYFNSIWSNVIVYWYCNCQWVSEKALIFLLSLCPRITHFMFNGTFSFHLVIGSQLWYSDRLFYYDGEVVWKTFSGNCRQSIKRKNIIIVSQRLFTAGRN